MYTVVLLVLACRATLVLVHERALHLLTHLMPELEHNLVCCVGLTLGNSMFPPACDSRVFFPSAKRVTTSFRSTIHRRKVPWVLERSNMVYWSLFPFSCAFVGVTCWCVPNIVLAHMYMCVSRSFGIYKGVSNITPKSKPSQNGVMSPTLA